jgi:ankyrin repeat protein
MKILIILLLSLPVLSKSTKPQTVFRLIEENKYQKFSKALMTADLNQKDSQGSTPLIKAVQFGRLRMAQALIKKQVDVNLMDKRGHDALFYATANLNFATTQLLVENGAVLDRTYGKKLETVLFDPVRAGEIKLVKYLVLKNPKMIQIQNADGETVLFEAARYGMPDMADYLLSQGVIIELKNKKGYTAFDVSKEKKFKETQQIFEKYLEK